MSIQRNILEGQGYDLRLTVALVSSSSLSLYGCQQVPASVYTAFPEQALCLIRSALAPVSILHLPTPEPWHLLLKPHNHSQETQVKATCLTVSSRAKTAGRLPDTATLQQCWEQGRLRPKGNMTQPVTQLPLELRTSVLEPQLRWQQAVLGQPLDKHRTFFMRLVLLSHLTDGKDFFKKRLFKNVFIYTYIYIYESLMRNRNPSTHVLPYAFHTH